MAHRIQERLQKFQQNEHKHQQQQQQQNQQMPYQAVQGAAVVSYTPAILSTPFFLERTFTAGANGLNNNEWDETNVCPHKAKFLVLKKLNLSGMPAAPNNVLYLKSTLYKQPLIKAKDGDSMALDITIPISFDGGETVKFWIEGPTKGNLYQSLASGTLSLQMQFVSEL